LLVHTYIRSLPKYRTAGVSRPKRVRSTSLCYSRQCGIVLEPGSDRTDYTASFGLWRTARLR